MLLAVVPAGRQIAEQLAGDFQVGVKLTGNACQHSAVAAFLGRVHARKQAVAKVDQMHQQRLAFGLAQPVEVDAIEAWTGDQLGAKLCRQTIFECL